MFNFGVCWFLCFFVVFSDAIALVLFFLPGGNNTRVGERAPVNPRGGRRASASGASLRRADAEVQVSELPLPPPAREYPSPVARLLAVVFLYFFYTYLHSSPEIMFTHSIKKLSHFRSG